MLSAPIIRMPQAGVRDRSASASSRAFSACMQEHRIFTRVVPHAVDTPTGKTANGEPPVAPTAATTRTVATSRRRARSAQEKDRSRAGFTATSSTGSRGA